jgi:hypothetical protein
MNVEVFILINNVYLKKIYIKIKRYIEKIYTQWYNLGNKNKRCYIIGFRILTGEDC